jgi:hypothetical protein
MRLLTHLRRSVRRPRGLSQLQAHRRIPVNHTIHLIPIKRTIQIKALSLVKCPMEEIQVNQEASISLKLKERIILIYHNHMHIHSQIIVLIRQAIPNQAPLRISLLCIIKLHSLHQMDRRRVGGTPEVRILLFSHLCPLVSRYIKYIMDHVSNLFIPRPTHSHVVWPANFRLGVSDCIRRRRQYVRPCAECC